MKIFEKFQEKKSPNKECFFGDDSKILGGHTIDENYLMCEKTWDKFDMNDMGDYHNLYLKKDVLLLSNVIEKFIDTCLKFYGLRLCYYFSSHELSWDAMLKMTGVKLEQMSEIGKYLCIEKGWRGGVSYIAKQYAKGNSK